MVFVQSYGFSRENAALRGRFLTPQGVTLNFSKYLFTFAHLHTAAIIESVLSKQLDDLEPTLTRHGYNIKSLAEQFGAKPTEIRALFCGQLEATRANLAGMNIAKITIELLFQRLIQAFDLKVCKVKGEAKNGAFILASVWAYQICWLNNYRKKKNPADVKEQIENARFRLKL